MDIKSQLPMNIGASLKGDGVIIESKFRRADLLLNLLDFRSGLTLYPGWLTGVFSYFASQSFLPDTHRDRISSFYSKILLTQKISSTTSSVYYGSKFDNHLKLLAAGKNESTITTKSSAGVIESPIVRYLPHEVEMMQKYSCDSATMNFDNVFSANAIKSTTGWKDTIERLGYLSGNNYYLEVAMAAVQESPTLFRETSLPLLFKSLQNAIAVPGGFSDKAGAESLADSQFGDISLLYRLSVTSEKGKDQASTDVYKSLTVPYSFFNFKEASLKGIDLDSIDFKSAVAAKAKLFMTWLPRFMCMTWDNFSKAVPTIAGAAKDDPIVREVQYSTIARCLYSIVLAPYFNELIVRFQELSHPWLKSIYAQDIKLKLLYEEMEKSVNAIKQYSFADWDYFYNQMNQTDSCMVKGVKINANDIPRWIFNLLTGKDLVTVTNTFLKRAANESVSLSEGLWLHKKLNYDFGLADPTNVLINDSSHVASWDSIVSSLYKIMEDTKKFFTNFLNGQEVKWYLKPTWSSCTQNVLTYIKGFKERFKNVFDSILTPSVIGVSKYSMEYSDISSSEIESNPMIKMSVNMVCEKGRQIDQQYFKDFNIRRKFNFNNFTIRGLNEVETYKRIKDEISIPLNFVKVYRAPHQALDLKFPWGQSISKLHPGLALRSGTSQIGYEKSEIIKALGYANTDTFDVDFEAWLPNPSQYGSIASKNMCDPSLEHILELAASFANVGVIMCLKSKNGAWSDDELKEFDNYSSLFTKVDWAKVEATNVTLQNLIKSKTEIDTIEKTTALTADQIKQRNEIINNINKVTLEVEKLKSSNAWLSNDKHEQKAFESMLEKWYIPGYSKDKTTVNTVEHDANSFSHRPMGLDLSKPENMYEALKNSKPIQLIKGIILMPYSALQLPPSIFEGRDSDAPKVKLTSRPTWGYEVNLVAPTDNIFYRDLRVTSVIGKDLIYEPIKNKWICVFCMYQDTSHFEMRMIGLETTRFELNPLIFFFEEGETKGHYTLRTLQRAILDDAIIKEDVMFETAKKEITIPSSFYPTKSSKGFESIVPDELPDGGLL